MRDQVPAIQHIASTARPRWSLIIAASLVVLLTYAVLIESWRRVLGAMGGVLTVADAARIWLVSSLTRYIPGVFWQLGAMTEMARRRGVPVAVSTGSAILTALVSLFTGIAVAAAFAARAPELPPKTRWVIGLGTLALAVAPFLLPRLAGVARRLTGRDITLPKVGIRPIAILGAATLVQWLAYGLAFWLLVQGLFPEGSPSLAGCIAVYTISYLAGWLNPAPAGIGAVEGSIVILAPEMGVATAAQAAVLAVVVRLWRTLLEVLPGFIALIYTPKALRQPAA